MIWEVATQQSRNVSSSIWCCFPPNPCNGEQHFFVCIFCFGIFRPRCNFISAWSSKAGGETCMNLSGNFQRTQSFLNASRNQCCSMFPDPWCAFSLGSIQNPSISLSKCTPYQSNSNLIPRTYVAEPHHPLFKMRKISPAQNFQPEAPSPYRDIDNTTGTMFELGNFIISGDSKEETRSNRIHHLALIYSAIRKKQIPCTQFLTGPVFNEGSGLRKNAVFDNCFLGILSLFLSFSLPIEAEIFQEFQTWWGMFSPRLFNPQKKARSMRQPSFTHWLKNPTIVCEFSIYHWFSCRLKYFLFLSHGCKPLCQLYVNTKSSILILSI